MKKFIFLTAFLAATAANALEWMPMGARALGMGGAGVAETNGPMASYWNPAALGRPTENAYGFLVPFNIHAAVTGDVVEGAKDLQTAQKACPGANCNVSDVTKALNELNQPGNGLRIDAGTGGDFKIGKMAFFANGFLDAGAVPNVDTVHTSTDPLSANSVANNTSRLIIKGVRLLEFGGGYGHELPFIPGLYVGGNVKLMQAQVGYTSIGVVNNNSGDSDVLKDFKNGAKISENIGFDAGALWDISKTFDGAWFNPRAGLVWRNINNPHFSLPAAAVADGVTGHYSVNSQMRVGGSLQPLHWWNIAADLDLTNNLTPVDNVASRQFSLGTEVNVFNRSWINIPIRVGLSRNLAEAGSGTMISAGTGLNFLHFMVDVSGSVSPQTVPTQSVGASKNIPREVAAAIQVGFLFGGSEDDSAARARAAQDAQPLPVTQPQSQPQSPPLPAAAVNQVKANSDKAQQDLNKEAAQPKTP